ncbi:hypothetical protein PG326_02920 [Riemerella anatipestifer]|uniref:hypothetical protein n=1 Tax=Riemerella anatipestifer TaxID=34085 RepID=UPI0013752156|nr:hypothetical protein [Riemerella anatipestifer]MDY3344208.1 hypothetical protein [Riemerella anatipestifer]MDY3357288.1 hypothetical protein [Riemerella anatipestifer]
MKKCIYLLLLSLCFNCNPLYEEYKNLNKEISKSKLYKEQLKILRPILSKQKKPVILIINWKKNILKKDGSLYYSALLYDSSNKKIGLFRTTEKKPEVVIATEDLSDNHFKELLHILDNYLNGNEAYLLSLQDSFSCSESTPYYIYDFIKNKKLEINSFFFNKDGKIIQ